MEKSDVLNLMLKCKYRLKYLELQPSSPEIETKKRKLNRIIDDIIDKHFRINLTMNDIDFNKDKQMDLSNVPCVPMNTSESSGYAISLKDSMACYTFKIK